MSALLVEKVNGGIRCRTPKCTNTGRYRLRIASHYVMAEGTLTHQKELLCKKHAQEAEAIWEEMAGRAPAETEAVAA